MKGIEITETGTFTAVMRSENKQYGEDKTVVMTQDGSSSTGTITSWGIGQATGPEKSSFRGFGIWGPSNTGKLAAFNNMTIVFNTEVMEKIFQLKVGNGSKKGRRRVIERPVLPFCQTVFL